MTKKQEPAKSVRTGSAASPRRDTAPVSHCGMDDEFGPVRFLPDDELLGIMTGYKWLTGKEFRADARQA